MMALSEILDRLNDDPSVRRRLQFADTVVRIEAGEDQWILSLHGGTVGIAPPDAEATITIGITAEAWSAFQLPVPPPGCHDIYAMAETGRATITGDFLTLFRYSYVLKDVLQQLATGRMFG